MNSDVRSNSNLLSRNIVICFSILIIWLGAFYDTILSAVNIWQKSDTFAHGFFIIPIVMWLFSKEREYLESSEVNHSVLALFPFLVFILFWLIGQAADISVVSQFASFALLPLSFWLIFGNKFAWKFKFPLSFILFSVPMGNALIPALQEITAEITVYFIKLSGIPVFYEGLYITIPSGVFEVAVACSGIRYLIASVTIGCLYAHLTYSSIKKQLIFIVLSIIIPILANGIRAYLIVIIAHLSNLEYATGIDHLIYGWIFFGLVIGLMFYIGGFWADSFPTDKKSENKNTGIYTFKYWLSFPIISLIGALILNLNIIETKTPESPHTVKQLLDFKAKNNNSTSGVKFDNPLAEFFGENDRNIEFYTAAFAHKQSKGELISSSNKTYNNELWSIVSRNLVDFKYANKHISIIHEHIVTSQGRVKDIYSWYQIDGKVITNRLEVKIRQAFLSFIGSSSVGYVNVISYEHSGKLSERAMFKLWLEDNFAVMVNNNISDELLK